jgi:hypothetical protein
MRRNRLRLTAATKRSLLRAAAAGITQLDRRQRRPPGPPRAEEQPRPVRHRPAPLANSRQVDPVQPQQERRLQQAAAEPQLAAAESQLGAAVQARPPPE